MAFVFTIELAVREDKQLGYVDETQPPSLHYLFVPINSVSSTEITVSPIVCSSKSFVANLGSRTRGFHFCHSFQSASSFRSCRMSKFTSRRLTFSASASALATFGTNWSASYRPYTWNSRSFQDGLERREIFCEFGHSERDRLHQKELREKRGYELLNVLLNTTTTTIVTTVVLDIISKQPKRELSDAAHSHIAR